MKRVFAGMILLAVTAAPAFAQPAERGFVAAMVGATVGAGPGAVFAGSIGFKATDKIQILGEFGRMQNILPSKVNDQVDVAAAIAANSLGGKHSSTATARANYGLVGFRYDLGLVSGAQTFTEFGVGAASVKSHVSAVIRGSETLQGDISGLVTTPFTASTPATKAAMMIGGGLILGITQNTAVEMGARYVRVFTNNPGINTGKIYGGYRVAF